MCNPISDATRKEAMENMITGKKRTLCGNLNIKLIAIWLMTVIIIVLFCTKCRTDQNAQFMHDIYFWEYENGIGNTIVYKYNVKNNAIEKIGEVDGFFEQYKLNRKEKYIICVLRRLTDGNIENSIVKYNLENMCCEECISSGEIRDLNEGEFIGSKMEIWDDGNSILLTYSYETEIVYILYDLKTGRYQYKDLDKEKVDIEGISTYSIYPSGNGEKYAFFKTNRMKKLYLYDVKSGTSHCIISTGWNTNLSSPVGWDESGEYLFYIKNFHSIIWNHADVSGMIYDLKTKKSYTIFKVNNTDHIFEFIEEVPYREGGDCE